MQNGSLSICGRYFIRLFYDERVKPGAEEMAQGRFPLANYLGSIFSFSSLMFFAGESVFSTLTYVNPLCLN